MADFVRFAIEKEEKIQEEILLNDKDFVVDVVRSECFQLWTGHFSNIKSIVIRIEKWNVFFLMWKRILNAVKWGAMIQLSVAQLQQVSYSFVVEHPNL